MVDATGDAWIRLLLALGAELAELIFAGDTGLSELIVVGGVGLAVVLLRLTGGGSLRPTGVNGFGSGPAAQHFRSVIGWVCMWS